jgi:hypothetical protein
MPTIELTRSVVAAEPVLRGEHEGILDGGLDALAPAVDKSAPRGWLMAAGIAAGIVALAGHSGRGTTAATPAIATARPAPPSPGLEASPSPTAPRPAVTRARAKDPARFAVEVEHSLKEGRLRLWLDGQLKLDRRLDSRTVAKVASRPAAGGQAVVDIEPGSHELAVEVAWGDKVRSEHMTTVFRPGESRVLAARVGGLFKKSLSLRWR